MKVHQAIKFRLYPTSEQVELFQKTIGCCRVVYNLALEQRQTFGRKGRSFSCFGQTKELTALKQEVEWLKEVPNHCLQQALHDLDAAFKRFYSKLGGYPRPRRRFDNQSFRFPDPLQIAVKKGAIKLPKAGWVKMCMHRPLQGRLLNVTVVREGDAWFASIAVEKNIKVRQPRADDVTARTIEGIDIGVKQPITAASGAMYPLARISPEEMRKKARLQRTLQRRKKGSNNKAKARRALARHEAKIARRRKHHQHVATYRLATRNAVVVIEDLKVKNMTASARGTVENPGKNVRQKAGLNRSILDVAPGEIRRQLAYKTKWYGSRLVAVNPAYTSQYCSSCGRHPKDDASTRHLDDGRLSQSLFVCPLCGHTENADLNAAKNIRWRGIHAIGDPAEGIPVADHGGLGAEPALEVVRNLHGPNRLPEAT